MIDLHCHILPELDDGSQSLEESLAMARMAVNSGVRAMAATPHCMGERAVSGVPKISMPGYSFRGTPVSSSA